MNEPDIQQNDILHIFEWINAQLNDLTDLHTIHTQRIFLFKRFFTYTHIFTIYVYISMYITNDKKKLCI